MKKFFAYLWAIMSLALIFYSLFKNINGYLIALFIFIGLIGSLVIVLGKRNKFALSLGSILIALELCVLFF